MFRHSRYRLSVAREQFATFAETYPERVAAMVHLAVYFLILGTSIYLAIRAAILASVTINHPW
jgi:hypothetical protein